MKKLGKKRCGCSRRLHGRLFNLFEEEQVRFVSDASTFHSFPELLRLRELAGILQVIPLKKDDQFVWIVSVSEKASSFGAAFLACCTVFIEDWLPLGIVFDLMPN